MIASILSILYYTLLILWPILVGLAIGWLLRRVTSLEKALKKANADINSLHKNQNVLFSALRDLQKGIRKHDKSLKREIRISARSQEAGPEES